MLEFRLSGTRSNTVSGVSSNSDSGTGSNNISNMSSDSDNKLGSMVRV